MHDIYISLLIGLVSCGFIYSKFINQRHIDGKQLAQMLALIFLMTTILTYTILKFILKI